MTAKTIQKLVSIYIICLICCIPSIIYATYCEYTLDLAIWLGMFIFAIIYFCIGYYISKKLNDCQKLLNKADLMAVSRGFKNYYEYENCFLKNHNFFTDKKNINISEDNIIYKSISERLEFICYYTDYADIYSMLDGLTKNTKQTF